MDAGLVLDGLLTIARDEDNAPAARVSAYRSLGDFLNLWHRPSAIDEMARGFLSTSQGPARLLSKHRPRSWTAAVAGSTWPDGGG